MGNKMLYVNKTATAIARSACVLGTDPLKKAASWQKRIGRFPGKQTS